MIFTNYSSLYLLACLVAGTVAREAIVGGDNADLDYQVSLQYPYNRHACGGGVIRNNYVITAAHCVIDHNGNFIPGRIWIVAVTLSLIFNNAYTQVTLVQRIYAPKEYNPKSNNNVADIAVLKLNSSLKYPRRPNVTQWLELPSRNVHRNLELSRGTIAGYGWNHIRPNRRGSIIGSSDTFLYSAQANVIPNKECEQAYHYRSIDREKLFCAKIESSATVYGVCKGDTGGLLVSDDDANSLNGIVMGVLSRISPRCNETHHPALYTRVSYYREFIDDALADRNSSNIRLNEHLL